MALTEEQTKVRNANKTKNLIFQADHNRASSNINSIGCIERYEDAEYRFCKWLGENTELKNLKNVSARISFLMMKITPEVRLSDVAFMYCFADRRHSMDIYVSFA